MAVAGYQQHDTVSGNVGRQRGSADSRPGGSRAAGLGLGATDTVVTLTIGTHAIDRD